MRDARLGLARSMIFRGQAVLLGVVLAGGLAGWAQAPSGKHTITVTFTYDFRLTPACAGKVRKNCVTQFNIYDLSAGFKNRTKLFSIPVGTDVGKGVKEFSATSPLLLFESGKHLIGAAAQGPEPGKLESDPRLCKVWVEVPASQEAPQQGPPSQQAPQPPPS